MGRELQLAAGDRSRTLAVAAVGDVHVGLDSRGLIRPGLLDVAAHADALLIAGDLTQRGTREEGQVLAEELADLGLPVVCVLGNHDYHAGAEELIRRDLEDAGVTVLEGESFVIARRQMRLGIAGVKGFGGGFAGACGSEFGEPEMKSFIHHTKATAQRLARALADISTCDVKVALTHYAPIKDTLQGERLEIYPFLGSYLLGEVIDAAACDLAVHGHAHRGIEPGVTAAGVPVRNVARPVIQHAYKIYLLSPDGSLSSATLNDSAKSAPSLTPTALSAAALRTTS